MSQHECVLVNFYFCVREKNRERKGERERECMCSRVKEVFEKDTILLRKGVDHPLTIFKKFNLIKKNSSQFEPFQVKETKFICIK